MSARTLQLRGLLVCLLLATLGENCAIADGQSDIGTVTAIDIYRVTDNNQPVNAGTVLGGIAGGIIGHQIGSGGGNTAATIVGTIGGAVVGNQIEKNKTQGSRYRITVKLDSGSSLIVEDTRDLNLRVGDRVRLDDGHIRRI